MMFRKLLPHEIEVRTQSISKDGKGAILLLYKDARCDMNILDETIGSLNWKREHSRDNANCTVSLYNEVIGEWISKEDTGSESNQDAQKGLASDSFKRACFNWGIGRELYTSPFIWISADKVANLKYARYACEDIGYDEKCHINYLVISSKGKVVFKHGNKINQKEVDKQTALEFVNNKMAELVDFHGSKENVYALLNVTAEQFLKEYKKEIEKVAERIKILTSGARMNNDEIIKQEEATETKVVELDD